MSSLIEGIKAKAKANKQHILLPEGEEERTVQAAAIIKEQGLADVTLFGKPEKIAAIAAQYNADIAGIDIIDPENHELYPAYVEKFYEMRKLKGVTPEKAAVTMKDPLFFAAMMVKDKKADGFVSGAINTTGNTLRPGLQIVKMRPGINQHQPRRRSAGRDRPLHRGERQGPAGLQGAPRGHAELLHQGLCQA